MSATPRETVTRCAETDLPADTCDHCRTTGATSTYTAARNTWTTPQEPVGARPRPKMATQPRPARGLPVLGGTREHGQDPDLHDMVEELTRPHSHRERLERDTDAAGERWTGHHHTEAPALVHQLLAADKTGTGDRAGSTPQSRPAARVESIDTLMLIDSEAARWLRLLGEDDPGDQYVNGRPVPGSGTIRNLIRVRALHPSATSCGQPRPRYIETTDVDDEGRSHTARHPACCARHQIEHDVRRWWTQARIVSGWDTAAYRPWNTCPVCEHRGGLLINDLGAGGHAAVCIECRSIWAPSEIGLLAEHIRWENAEDDDPTTPPTNTPATTTQETP